MGTANYTTKPCQLPPLARNNMDKPHSLLARQLRRLKECDYKHPPNLEKWQNFLDSVNRSYNDADQYRYTTERSIDISSQELQALYKKLEDERQRLEAIMSEGMCYIDKDWNLTSINDEASRLLGISREQLLGKNIYSVCHLYPTNETDRPLELSILQTVLTNAKPYRCDSGAIKANNGRRIPVSFALNPLLENQEFVGAVMVFHDITDRMLTETRLKSATHHAQATYHSKTKILKTLCQIIRQPINEIDQTLNQIESNEKIFAKKLKLLTNELDQLSHDIENIITLNADEDKPNKKQFDLENLFSELTQDFYRQNKIENAKLHTNIENMCPTNFEGDITQLKRLLNCLVRSMFKKSNNHSISIKASTAEIRNNTININFNISNEITCTEQGSIETKIANENEVDLYYAMCNMMCTLLGGSMRIEKKQNNTDSITASIPLKIIIIPSQSQYKTTLNSASISPESELLKSQKFNISILLIDNNLSRMHLSKRLIGLLGARVMTYNLESEAQPDNNQYDIVILSTKLPKEKSKSIVQHIRAHDKNTNTHTPIIGIQDKDPVNHSTPSYLDDAINTPLSLGQLSELFKRWTQQKNN